MPCDGGTAPAAVLFHCDAGPGVGWGHVSRCVGLAETFADAGLACQGFIVPAAAGVERLVHAAAFPCVPVAGQEQALGAVARHCTADTIVVLDGYGYTPEYVAQLRAAGARSVFYIDDMHTWASWPVDWVLAFSAVSEGRAFDPAHAFVGPRYTPLKRRYRQRRDPSSSNTRRADRCLVALGGLDVRGQLASCALTAQHMFPEVWVANGTVLGEASQERLRRAGIALLAPQADLADELAECALCISGGGMTKYEAIFMGTPTLVIDQTELQHRDTQRLVQRGLVEATGPDADDARMVQSMRALAQQGRREALRNACLASGFGEATFDLARAMMAR